MLKNILMLQNFKDYRNLTRTPAHELSTGENGRNFFHNVGGGGPLKFFLSIIWVQSCNLVEPFMNSTLGKPQKYIQRRMIEGEYERSIGTIRMIINKKEFWALSIRIICRLPQHLVLATLVWHFVLSFICTFYQLTLCFIGSLSSLSGKPSPFTGTAPSNFWSSFGSSDKVSLSFQDIGTVLCHVCVCHYWTLSIYLLNSAHIWRPKGQVHWHHRGSQSSWWAPHDVWRCATQNLCCCCLYCQHLR